MSSDKKTVGEEENSLDEMLYFNKLEYDFVGQGSLEGEEDFESHMQNFYWGEGGDLEHIIGLSSHVSEMSEDVEKRLEMHEDELVSYGDFYDNSSLYMDYLTKDFWRYDATLEQSVEKNRSVGLEGEVVSESSGEDIGAIYFSESNGNNGNENGSGEYYESFRKKVNPEKVKQDKEERHELERKLAEMAQSKVIEPENSLENMKYQQTSESKKYGGKTEPGRLVKGISFDVPLSKKVKTYAEFSKKLSSEKKAFVEECDLPIDSTVLYYGEKLMFLEFLGVESVWYRGVLTPLKKVPRDATSRTAVGEAAKILYHTIKGD